MDVPLWTRAAVLGALVFRGLHGFVHPKTGLHPVRCRRHETEGELR